MIYILRHIKYRTFYSLESSTVIIEKAFKFESKRQAENKKRKMKHPHRWEIVEVKKCIIIIN